MEMVIMSPWRLSTRCCRAPVAP